jgi:hypothetical protein
MVNCQKCRSVNVKVEGLNFAKLKIEGIPAEKGNEEKYSFLCFDCGSSWVSEPQVRKDYYEYLWLKGRTDLIVRDVGARGTYGPPQHIDKDEMMKRAELAKKISSSYTHVLDIDPGEWHDIHLDAF